MFQSNSHRRLNQLTGEWNLVSPHRTQRPWLGKHEGVPSTPKKEYAGDCYLCPGNKRANGELNPQYKSTFVFSNDFPAFNAAAAQKEIITDNLLIAKPEYGISRVVCFSPRHDLTLADLSVEEIIAVIKTWRDEYRALGGMEPINYVQIFENKGEMMGCSNPHPHGQIWAQESIPEIPAKEDIKQKEFFNKHGETLLSAYLRTELSSEARTLYENDDFVLLVPFWAVWPYETMIVSKEPYPGFSGMPGTADSTFADILRRVTNLYDKVFNINFPYSSGIHQAPTTGGNNDHWHFHMHFYPPLLRSATIKKFMVGYEMLGEPQRDITPETSADILRQLL